MYCRAVSKSVFWCLISLLLYACVTPTGHRQTIVDDGFVLEVFAPHKEAKKQISFNQQQTQFAYLPDDVQIRLTVEDGTSTHQLNITGNNTEIDYQYRLNGRLTAFEANEAQWLSSIIPTIIKKSGIGQSM